MVKQNVLFDVNIAGDWIGGIYYIRNIIYQIVNSSSAAERCHPVIVCSEKYAGLFDEFRGMAKIFVFADGNRKQRLIALFKAIPKSKWIYRYNQYKFDPLNLLKRKAIYWIPDFQEYHYPEFFSPEEVDRRRLAASEIARSGQPLVLSSQDCRRDFEEQFGTDKKNLYVIPFVSAIVNEVSKLNAEKRKEILKRYHLQGKPFVLIANQFWVHKNHRVVFEAIAALKQKGQLQDMIYVFTGAKKDYRNEKYFDSLSELIETSGIKDNVVLLGFIDRIDQLGLMYQAEYIIQPSLFEGWGTVLEDAKVLDKTVLLSDIPVHREQQNSKCYLFNPSDPEELAILMKEENEKKHQSDPESGISDMKKRAALYAKEFEHMIEEISK